MKTHIFKILAALIVLGVIGCMLEVYAYRKPVRKVRPIGRSYKHRKPPVKAKKEHHLKNVKRGTIIKFLPNGHRKVVVGKKHYFYHGGVYYIAATSGYKVVRPPIGAIVYALPSGYEEIYIDGETYYLIDEIYYKSEIRQGKQVFIVVDLS